MDVQQVDPDRILRKMDPFIIFDARNLQNGKYCQTGEETTRRALCFRVSNDLISKVAVEINSAGIARCGATTEEGFFGPSQIRKRGDARSSNMDASRQL